MKENRWQDIYSHLKKEGFEVYAPAQKIGECKSKYIVLKYSGATKIVGLSSKRDLYTIMCYVPENEYSSLNTFIDEVEESMFKLKPMIEQYSQPLSSYFDDTLKAHMVSWDYANARVIRKL